MFEKRQNEYVCGSVPSADEIRAFTEARIAAGESEASVVIPAQALPLFEENGYCTDGVSILENSEELFRVHRSFAFEGCALLTFPKAPEVVRTRTVFEASAVQKAVLRITALGYFEAYLNGEPVSEDLLIPAKSDYVQRDLSHTSYPIRDTMSHRIYYYEYDVTQKLAVGENVLAAQIGNGWFAAEKNRAENMPRWGEKLLIYRLEQTLEDGSKITVFSSPENTVWNRSHILESSLYYGEYHNYLFYEEGWNKPGFSDENWERAASSPLPLTFFQKADFPADRVCGRIKPLLLKQYGDHKLYDLGETASGRPIVRGTENAMQNAEIHLRYTDLVAPDMSFVLRHTGGWWRAQEDRFVLSDAVKHAELYPRFLWHASRYIEVTGPGELTAFEKVQTPIERVSSFKSDSKTLNWIFRAYVNTQTANVHGCVPSDCPHRERLGYTGDGQLTCGAVMSVFDARDMYKKWMLDIRDCQDIHNGHVQHTAPFYGGGGGPGGWGGAAVIVPYRYYKFYNDKEALRVAYPSMQAYMRYMTAHCKDGIVTHEEPDGWCLGDWCPPDNKILLPETFVNTYFLAKCADMCRETALILGRHEDASYYEMLSASTREAFDRHFYNPASGSYCEGVQGADAFAVDLGVGSDATLRNLVSKYEALRTFDTGIFGTDILIRVLFSKGYGSLAFTLLTNEKETSFYNMMRNGAQNLWENWDGCDSLCHPMFGAVVEYFFSEILGIRRLNDNAGFTDVEIRPVHIPELQNVSGTMGTPWGRITVVIATDERGYRNVSFIADPGIRIHNR